MVPIATQTRHTKVALLENVMGLDRALPDVLDELQTIPGYTIEYRTVDPKLAHQFRYFLHRLAIAMNLKKLYDSDVTPSLQG